MNRPRFQLGAPVLRVALLMGIVAQRLVGSERFGGYPIRQHAAQAPPRRQRPAATTEAAARQTGEAHPVIVATSNRSDPALGAG